MKVTGKKQSFLTRYITVSVMLLVLITHLILIQAVHISPWKGGAFGMFSTVNTPESHIVKVYNCTASGKKTVIIIPEKLKPKESKIRSIAIGFYINNFKQAIQKEKWVEGKEGIIDIETAGLIGDSTNYKPVKLNTIKLELWRYKFDGKSKKFYSTFIAEY